MQCCEASDACALLIQADHPLCIQQACLETIKLSLMRLPVADIVPQKVSAAALIEQLQQQQRQQLQQQQQQQQHGAANGEFF